MQRSRDPEKSSRRLEADIIAKFGVPPRLVPDVQALAGDMVDGIPGIPGVGLEIAAKLIRRFGSLEQVLKHRKETSPPSVRHNLIKHGDKAKLYLKLTTLRRDVPLDIEFKDLPLRPIMRSHLDEIVKALNPSANVSALFGLDLQDVRMVPRIEDPLEWWREELAAPGQRLPETPACGYYQTRLAKGAAFVPARIWREPHIDPVLKTDSGFDLLRCEVGGRARDAMAMFTRLSMNPIRENDYEFETADAAHAKAYRPDSAKANPYEKPNLSNHPSPKNPRRKS